MTTQELKSQADQIIDKLPEDISWDDLIYRIYVRQKIEKGLLDGKSERVRPTENIRIELGL